MNLDPTIASRNLGRWPAQKRRMGIGIQLPIFEVSSFGKPPRFADMLEMTRVAEDVGFDFIWLADHFIFRPPVAKEGTEFGSWDAWIAMAGLAQGTSRINFGHLVTCLGWRNPGSVAKMSETLDEISGGRFILGVGAGWHQPEYDAFGFPFDHRVSRFDDAMTIISDLFRTGASTHDGDFFSTDNAVNRPRGPLGATGGVPILIGSTSPRMLRIGASHCDAWNTVWHPDAAEAAPLIAKVEEACLEVGRDPNTFIRTAGSNIALEGYTGARGNPMTGSPSELAEKIAAFRDLGMRHFIAGIDPCTPASLEAFARIIEQVDAADRG